MPELIFHEDPGHGWLAVPTHQYPDAFDYGTGYGYRSYDGKIAYLEEDVEVGLFLRAHPDARKHITTVYHDDNRIRGLPSIGIGKVGREYLSSK